jgi:hypothetical protein
MCVCVRTVTTILSPFFWLARANPKDTFVSSRWSLTSRSPGGAAAGGVGGDDIAAVVQKRSKNTYNFLSV